MEAQFQKSLQFYFIAQNCTSAKNLKDKVENAVKAGATLVHYKSDDFVLKQFNEIFEVRNFLKCNHIPFLIQDNILLAKALDADGVVLDAEKGAGETVKEILGRFSILGVSLSSDNIKDIDLNICDFCLISPGAEKIFKLPDSAFKLLEIIKKTDTPIVLPNEEIKMIWEKSFHSKAAGIVLTHDMLNEKHISMITESRGFTSQISLDALWNNEFDLIERLLKIGHKSNNHLHSGIIVPAGDDACLLKSIQHPVVTTDSHVENVHFRLDWQTPEEVGQKAVAVTLSDLAASYAKPVSVFINFGLPPYISNKTAEAVYKGIWGALEQYGCALGGGNISANSRVSLDLFAIGEGGNIFPCRSNASPGYGLYCTGPLGLARAGLDALQRKVSIYDQVISRFKYPVARFDAADVLASYGVDCVMDISDGLKGDAGHMAKASKITIEFSMTPDIIDFHLDAYCNAYGLNAYEMAISGGEDYELLFACPPEIYIKVKEKLKDVYQVGKCCPFDGSYLRNVPSVDSFQHGKGQREAGSRS